MNRSLPLLNNLPRIAAEVERADRVLVALDFDGTLCPIVKDPQEAGIAPQGLALLADLAALDHISVAIVSGRSIFDLKQRLPPGLTLAGNHGLEIEGPLVSFVVPSAEMWRQNVDHACWDLEAGFEGLRGVIVERKGLSATVHYRQAPEDLCTWIEATVRATVQPYLPRLVVTPALQAWEIRPNVSWNKGFAVKLLLQELGGARPALICAGDDTTDEDMFTALPEAMSIRVGRAPHTKARYSVHGTAELLGFLQFLTAIFRHSHDPSMTTAAGSFSASSQESA